MKTIFPQDGIVNVFCSVTYRDGVEQINETIRVPIKGHKAGMNLHKSVEEALIKLHGGNLMTATVVSVVGDFK